MLKIRHTGLYVNNLESMKDFYCRFFDMSVASYSVESGKYLETLVATEGVIANIYKLQCDDKTMLELIHPRDIDTKSVHSPSVTRLGCMHLAFTVNDLWSLYGRMKNEGVEFLSEPLDSPDGNVHVCFCKDPEGNYLELVEELK